MLTQLKKYDHFSIVCHCCVCILILSLLLARPAGASGFVCSMDVRLAFLQTTVIDVQRTSSDGLSVVLTENGKYFTKSAMVFNSKDGSKKVSLLGEGKLEAALLESVGSKVILLLSDEVDGLIVGLFPEGGPGCVENMLLAR